MKFHMLMFMNAWMMLVLMKSRCQNAKLNTGVLHTTAVVGPKEEVNRRVPIGPTLLG